MSGRKSTRAQENKSARIVLACTLMTCCAFFCQGGATGKTSTAEKDSSLKIYLLREAVIKGNSPSLGEVGIIRGEESLVAKASEIALGRLSVPGQEIIVDRSMVLSRLACNGIPASKVTLSGAERVMIKRQQRIIKGSEFVELASSFLAKKLAGGSVCQWDLLRTPADLVVPGVGKDIKLSPRLARSSAGNRAKVQIAVLANGRQAGVGEVTFRLKYNCRRVVTLVDIPAGASITAENVKIEKALSNYPEPADWRLPYGLVASRRLSANTVIRPNMIGPVKPKVLLKRNQTVAILIKRPGLLVTAIGKAMENGRAGECIKVKNVDSHRIIFAKVNEDGTVEPVF